MWLMSEVKLVEFGSEHSHAVRGDIIYQAKQL
jgi:hypothetical protein